MLSEVAVIPRSGFINRIQAIASAAILARQTGARLRVCWFPCAYVTTPAEDVFTEAWCTEFVVNESWVRQTYGAGVDDLPLYVSWNEREGFIGLRGHDVGEQALMDAFWTDVTDHQPAPRVLVIAGGTFFIPQPGREEAAVHADFLAAKRDFYRELPLSHEIESLAKAARDADSTPYLGLHLRYTDRSHEAPTRRQIRRAIARVAADTGLKRVFIASDSSAERDYWTREAEILGLVPWVFDASEVSGATAAMVDWRLLGEAERLVYFTASSYAVEAVVASGSWETSIGLGAAPLRSLAVRTSVLAQAGWRRLTHA